jgi:hypothetical protein
MSDAPHTTAFDDHETAAAAALQPAARRTTPRRRRWIARALVALSLLTGAVFLEATPASAYVGSNFLRDWATGRCLDGYGGTAYTWECQFGNPYQQWQPIYVDRANGNDEVLLYNLGTHNCLYRNGGLYRAPAINFDTCYFQPGNIATPSAVFQAHSVLNAWYRINLIDYFNACVDSNQVGQVGPNPCNGGGYQIWRLGY